jgi:hypothetical protein
LITDILAFYIVIMRKIVSLVSGLFLSLWWMLVAMPLFAAEWAVVQFEIIAPPTARINEAIDITVRAVDKDNKVVTGYRGSVIFVPENFGDIVPMPGRSITFGAEDNGEKKFSKGVTFKTAGKQKVNIVDVADDISWEALINVEASIIQSGTTLEELTIISPVKDSKVTSEVIAISGKTRKNSKVTFSLNGQDVGSVLSDESGIFTKSLTGITQAKNTLSASLVDGAGTVIGKSPEIPFEKIEGSVAYITTTVLPKTSVESGDELSFTVEAEKGLKEALLVIDGNALSLVEESEGKYSGKTWAPVKGWQYPVSITLKNALGESLSKDGVLQVEVTEKKSSFDSIKVSTLGSKVVFNFGLINPPLDLAKFKITYGEDAKNLNREVITWETKRIIKEWNRYEWYIDKLEQKNYNFKILGLKADDTVIEALASDTLTALIWW